MLKVIFRVERLALKLKYIEFQILAKKGYITIPLSPRLTIKNGQAQMDAQTEFLIIQNDPFLKIQVILNCVGSKKLGGQMELNVADWDENIHHSTIAALKKSPDKNAHICFTFLFIRKYDLIAYKPLVLYSDYRDKNLIEIEDIKKQLTKKHNYLEDEIKKLKQQNMTLQNNQKMKIEQMNYRKYNHDQKMKNYVQSIEKSNLKNSNLRKRNQQIMNMINKYGKDEIRHQLQRKYPQVRQMNNETNNSTKRKFRQMCNKTLQSNLKTKTDHSLKVSQPSQSSEGNQRQDRQRSRQRRSYRKTQTAQQ